MNPDHLRFDIIIAGGGAAGLSLAYRLANHEFSHLKIALIDPEIKTGTDHTWCSWLKGDQIFDNCAVNSFSKINVSGINFDNVYDINPYRYRMIQSSKFYDFVNHEIEKATHIHRFQKYVRAINPSSDGVTVKFNDSTIIVGKEVVKSYLDNPKSIKENNKLYLDQHFKGWFIKTEKPTFNPNQCTFMDFCIDQKGETRFMYVLPISEYKALVEVAIFSNAVLSLEEYESILKDYIHNNLKIHDYTIYDEEFGIIPMTVMDQQSNKIENVTLIGTAGGGIKASTGFGFERIQRQCDSIIQCIKNKQPFNTDIFPTRFKYYDATLLDILIRNKIPGDEVFLKLFEKNGATILLKFLDDKTNFIEELKIMYSTDKIKFATSFIAAFFKI
jgi:lycopene beta-cyclase